LYAVAIRQPRLLITSIFAPSPWNRSWYTLQRKFIGATADADVRHTVYLNGVTPELVGDDVALAGQSATNEGHSAALKKLVRDAKDRFADGRQVVIFPEGTRTAPGAPSDYKPGIAALYREIDVPVHPVATNSGVHWSARGQTIHRGTIVFEFLEPIPPGLKRAEFMRLLRERNETASAKLLAEGL